MNDIQSYKRQYNALLAREKKAEEYLDDPSRTPEEIEKWTPEFKRILSQLNDILSRIGQFTAAEISNGFEFGEPKNTQFDNLHNMDLIFKGVVSNG